MATIETSPPESTWVQHLCCQGGIDGILDSVNNKWILRLDALPRVGLVLREVCAAIVIGLYLLRRRPAGEQKHHCHQSEHDSLYFHNSSFLLSRLEIPMKPSRARTSGRLRSGSRSSRGC